MPADVPGGLVSLVFNRGTSMEGNLRREMRAIRDLVPKKMLSELRIKSGK
ncbi:hypothetical protein [Microcoleus sp. S13_B4]